MTLVQLARRSGELRIRKGTSPSLLELDLEPNQRVVGLEWRSPNQYSDNERLTADWIWTAWIESRL